MRKSSSGSRLSGLQDHTSPSKRGQISRPQGTLSPLRGFILLLAAALATAIACSSAREAPPGIDWSGDGDVISIGPCTSGATRSCHETLDQENGKLTCYHGEQQCVEGVWGPCADGETTVELDPRSAVYSDFFKRHGLAYSTATSCTNNACDPSCMNFLETPPVMTGTVSGTIPTVAWSPLLNEPCSTGADCQVNYRCEHPDSGTCAHSKCEAGAALASGCDDCVARICDADPTCCSGSWSSSCVAKVATVCDAVCDATCAHQPCGATGAPLSPSCDACVASTCASSGYEDCCTDFWSLACELKYRDECGIPPTVTEPTDGGSICDYSTFGRYEVQAQSTTLTGGWVGSPDNASFNLYGSTVHGNITGSASLNAYGATLDGDAHSGNGSVLWGTFTAGHGVVPGTPPSPTLPSKTVSCTTGSDPRTGTLAPGSYGDVTVAAGATLTLEEGTYTLNSLTLGAGATLELPDDGSIVTINACSSVYFSPNANMAGLTQSTAMNVSFYIDNGYFIAADNNDLFGMIIAKGSSSGTTPCPGGDPCNLSAVGPGGVFIGRNSLLYGIAVGDRRTDVRPGSQIDATGSEDMCELLWDPGTTTTYPACTPVAAGSPDESATCEDNSDGYQESTCSGYDLALELPNCDGTIDVCNHGTAGFSGMVTLGYWDAGSMQLATDSPTSPDGTCSESVTIAAGDCATMTCSSLPTGSDQTIMVDPTGAMGECDGRRLDNWSYLEAGNCSSVDDVQIYEAVCDEAGTSPRWGILTWDASTSGASTITFSVRTAASIGDLASAPAAVDVGVAEANSAALSPAGSTEICSRSIPATSTDVDDYCPPDITKLLGLGNNQSEHEVLELTVSGGGSGTSILNSYAITYSCVEDQ